MVEDRVWSVRGIPAAVRKAIAERADLERKTVGEWLLPVLQAALDQEPVAPAAPPDRLAALAERVEAVEEAVEHHRIMLVGEGRGILDRLRTIEAELDRLAGVEVAPVGRPADEEAPAENGAATAPAASGLPATEKEKVAPTPEMLTSGQQNAAAGPLVAGHLHRAKREGRRHHRIFGHQ